ncbi:MAG: class I fructose-bisphosphate aldolase [Candidatus Thorarchaeota archaeon]|jgi:class I fructose-bisphosphate aldolase
MTSRLDELDHLDLGKRVRLHRLMYEHGPGNGRMLFLPIDQGMEHGPSTFFPNPESANPEYQFKLALKGGYSGIALHLGLAQTYARKYAGAVPIVLKVNGKTRIPPDSHALSPLTASVQDAVRIGADAIGYTLYVGSPRQADDFIQFRKIKADADRYGMPIILWSYPRGEAIDAKGGRSSLYAIDYAARVALELGADAVKLNVPVDDPKTRGEQPEPYSSLEPSYEERVNRVVKTAGKIPVLFSGGSKLSDDDLLRRAKVTLEQGGNGFLFGRNLWQRPMKEALAMTEKLKKLMLEM